MPVKDNNMNMNLHHIEEVKICRDLYPASEDDGFRTEDTHVLTFKIKVEGSSLHSQSITLFSKEKLIIEGDI
jgi:hypothetical protein